MLPRGARAVAVTVTLAISVGMIAQKGCTAAMDVGGGASDGDLGADLQTASKATVNNDSCDRVPLCHASRTGT
jgi:hypothetical protein